MLALAAGGAFLLLRPHGGSPFGGRSGAHITVGLRSKPSSLDIRTNGERAVEQALIDNVYQTLLTMDSERAISANVAARWSESTDGLRYSFHLREGATFADGSPLNASAVVASLQRTIQGKQVGSDDLELAPSVETAGELAKIDGVQVSDGISTRKTLVAFNNAGSSPFSDEQVRQFTRFAIDVENPDETTVVITLHEPNPRLLEALAGRAGVIVNPNAHDADFAHASYGSGPFTVSSFTGNTIELARNEHYWQDKPELVIVNPNAHDADFAHASYGSGPFTVSSFTGNTIELARNEHYWQDKPELARVTLRYMPSDEALVGGMRDGSLDVALPQGAQAASELAKIDGVQVSDGISTRKTLVAFNNAGSSPFSDEQVRQFTRFAIDAAQIARTQPDAKAQLSGPISQLQPGYEDLNALFPFDLERAQSMRWYFAAGYFTPFTLLADEAHHDLAQRIVDEMAAIPMPVTLEVVDSATLASRVEAGDYVCALIEMDDPHDYTRFVDGSAMFGYQNGTLEVVDSATLASRVEAGDYVCALIEMDDPHDYTRFVDGSAMFGYQNGAAQEQYAKALAQTDFASYREQLRAFDRIVSQDAASAWLYTGKDHIAARQNLHVPQALAQTDFASYREQLRAFDRIVSQDAASAWLYTGKDHIAARQNLHVPRPNLIAWRLPLYQIA